MIRVHLEDTADTLFLARTRVVDIRTCIEVTGVHAEIAQTTYIRIGSDLERQSTERFLIVRVTYLCSFGIGISTVDHLGIQRTRQVSTYCIQHGLYAFVLERTTADHREDLHCQRTLADSHTNLILGNSGRIIKVFLHQRVVELRYRLQHLVAPLFCLCYEVGRNLFLHILSAHGLVMPKDSFHFHEVYDTLESLLSTDRNLDRTRSRTQHLFDLTNYVEEVSTGTVHLIHVAQTRYVVFISLAPYSLRLRLYTTYRTKSHNRTIEDTERTLYLHSEIHVTRSVYQVDLIFVTRIVPIGCSSSRGDSDTTLLLLNHPVHRSRTVMHLTDLMGKTRIEQDTLRCCCLTGVDVRHDTDVTV